MKSTTTNSRPKAIFAVVYSCGHSQTHKVYADVLEASKAACEARAAQGDLCFDCTLDGTPLAQRWGKAKAAPTAAPAVDPTADDWEDVWTAASATNAAQNDYANAVAAAIAVVRAGALPPALPTFSDDTAGQWYDLAA